MAKKSRGLGGVYILEPSTEHIDPKGGSNYGGIFEATTPLSFPTATPRKRPKRPGRKPDPEVKQRDDAWLVAYNNGLRSGDFDTEADFARHVDEQYSTVRKALQRARTRQKSR